METIAHLVTPYLFRTGSWIHTQLRHARRYRPIVITQAREDPAAFPFEPVHCVTDSLGTLARIGNRCRELAGWRMTRRYLELLRSERAVLIHAHLGWEGARALRVAHRAKLPLVTSFYGRDAGLLPRRWHWRARYRRLFRHGTAFFVEGPALGRQLARIGCPPEKIAVIHLGIDVDRIPFRVPRAPGTGPIEVLVSSSLRPKKGVTAAVAAFARAAADLPHARLRILGDGPQRAAVEAAIANHGLAERVVLEGYVSYERHLAALAATDLFLAPSRTAPDGDTEGGAPVALIEAQATGVPVISTRHADIPEVVRHDEGGWLAPEGDDAALAELLARLMRSPERWAQMGRRGRARVEAEFCARRQAERVADAYDRLLAGRPPA